MRTFVRLILLAAGVILLLAITYGIWLSGSFQSAYAAANSAGRPIAVSALAGIGGFVEAHQGALIAFALLIIALFTAALWCASSRLLSRSRYLERAYISGGGSFNPFENRFYATVDNYGKTPGTLLYIAVATCGSPDSIPEMPDYKKRYVREAIQPGTQGHVVLKHPLTNGDTVVYGRLYYEDIFNQPHSYGFILQIVDERGTTEPIVAPAAFTAWD